MCSTDNLDCCVSACCEPYLPKPFNVKGNDGARRKQISIGCTNKKKGTGI